MTQSQIGPVARGEAQAILDRAARRLVAERFGLKAPSEPLPTPPARRQPPEGPPRIDSWVYFVRSDDSEHVKIGRTSGKSPYRRVNQLQTGHVNRLELLAAIPGGKDLEEELHAELADYRVRGEWFRDVPALRAVIARHGGGDPDFR